MAINPLEGPYNPDKEFRFPYDRVFETAPIDDDASSTKDSDPYRIPPHNPHPIDIEGNTAINLGED